MDRDLLLPVSAQPTIQDQIEYAVSADEHGYDRVWLPETWGRDAVSTLAAIAARTDRIGIGTSISSVYSRSPALLGQTAATLAELSNGRFRLGLGQSAPPVNELWHGVDHERGLRRLREAIEIVRRVLTGEVVDYAGDVFDLSGFRLRSEPPSPPPRIDAAAMGPTAMELAGRFADGVHTTTVTRPGLRESLDHFRRGLELGDRAREDVRVMVGIPCCALADGDRARSRVRHHLAFYVGSMGTAYRDHLARQGFESEADDVARLWANGDTDAAEDVFADAALADLGAGGTPDEVDATLENWAAMDGVDAVVPVLPVHASVAENLATIEAVGPS